MDRDLKEPAPRYRPALTNRAFDIAHMAAGRYGLLRVRGELDRSHASAFGQAIERALTSDTRRLVIDLRDVAVIDSPVLAVLLDAQEQSQRLDVELTLVCDLSSCLRAFALAGFDHSFDVHPSLTDALASPGDRAA